MMDSRKDNILYMSTWKKEVATGTVLTIVNKE